MSCDPEKRDFDFANVLECFRTKPADVDRAFVHTCYKWYKSAPDQPDHPLGNPKHIALQLHTNASAKFCSIKPTERLTTKLDPQGSRRCSDMDLGKKVTRQYCSEEHRINPRKGRTDSAINCSQVGLGEAVWREEVAKYCKANPSERYCSCYNVVNGVCNQNKSAAGCKAVDLPVELANEDALGQANYDKLKKSAHCRGAVCQPNNYMPKSTPSCPDAIEICGKEFPTGATTNSQLIRHCVVGQGGMSEEELEEFLGGEIPPLGEWNTKKKKKTAKQKDEQALLMITAATLAMSCCCLAMIAVATQKRA